MQPSLYCTEQPQSLFFLFFLLVGVASHSTSPLFPVLLLSSLRCCCCGCSRLENEKEYFYTNKKKNSRSNTRERNSVRSFSLSIEGRLCSRVGHDCGLFLFVLFAVFFLCDVARYLCLSTKVCIGTLNCALRRSLALSDPSAVCATCAN